MSESEVKTVSIFKRHAYLFSTLAAITALVLLLLSLLPIAVRMGATSWLESHGVQQAKIDNVDLNLFSSTLLIEGLSADKGLTVERLALTIDWWPLIEHRLFVRSVELKGVNVGVQQTKSGGWQLSTIKLDEATDGLTLEKEKGAEKSWQVVLNEIDVADIRVKAEGEIDKENFNLSLPITSLKLILENVESNGAQHLTSTITLGKVIFNGFGYAFENDSLQLDSAIYLPAIGSGIMSGWKLDNLNLNSYGLKLRDSRHNVQLATAKKIEIDKAYVAGSKTVKFELLSIQNVGLPTVKKNSLGKLGKLELSGVNLDPAGDYRVKKLVAYDVFASLKKLKNGNMQVLNRLDAERKPDATKVSERGGAPTPKTKVSKRPIVYIDEFRISEGSSFTFRDESVFPAFDAKVEVENFNFSPLDLSGKDAGKVHAQLRLNKNALLNMSGNLSLKPDDLHANLKVALKNFEMLGLAAYLRSDLGKLIKTGQLDLISDIRIAKNEIDSQNKLLIRKLVMDDVNESRKAELSIGMPVDMALDMVRDARGDISMDVPIAGRLDDPNINVNDVIRTALFSSMKAGVMTYAKLVLQPYGAIYAVAEMAVGAAQKAAKPKLTAIAFKERSTTLSMDMSDYTSKIAELMKGKAFRLEVCGVATRIEGEVPPQLTVAPVASKAALPPQALSNAQLLQLAKGRSDAVLTAIQEHGISADRLFSCRPTIDESLIKAKARVEMTLD